MDLTIDPTAAVPVSEQIAEAIRFAIATGRLAKGERLPSVRGLARTVLVNPNTVAKVYRDLEREGVIRTRPGSGAFVAERALARCRKASRGVVTAAVRAAVEKGRAAGLPENEILKLTRECLEEAGANTHGR
jgi:GntR family transcriptional regulator